MKVDVSKPHNHGTFNKGGLNQSSCNFGFVQPSRMIQLQPGEDAEISFAHNTIMTPLRCPTQGEISLKHYISSVKIQDVWTPFPNFYSARPYSWTDAQASTPDHIPSINYAALFLTLLAYDKRCMIVYSDKIDENQTSKVHANMRDLPTVTYAPSTTPKAIWMARKDDLPSSAQSSGMSDFFLCAKNLYNYLHNINVLEGMIFDPSAFDPLGSADIDYNAGITVEDGTSTDPRTVYHFDGYDYFIPFNRQNSYKGFYIKLGAFGLKLREIFMGLMYNIDSVLLGSNYPSGDDLSVKDSVLPLLAYCKSIYDTFGIKRFVDYPLTYIGRTINYLSNNFGYDPTKYLNWTPSFMGDIDPDEYPVTTEWFNKINLGTGDTLYRNNCLRFISLIGCSVVEMVYNSFYQLDVDYYSSVETNIGRNPGLGSVSFTSQSDAYYEGEEFYRNDVTRVNLDNSGVVPDTGPDYPQWINLALRALRWVNMDRIAGGSVYKWLEEHGHKGMQTPQTLHIPVLDRHTASLDIAKLPTTTTIPSEDVYTGDFGAIGGGQSTSGTTHVHSETFSYVFMFYCIVPKVGYYQGVHYAYEQQSFGDFYRDEFDSIGYVPVSSRRFHGSSNITVGFHPRYFDAKLGDGSLNVINGDLTRHSTYRSFDPYYLDRQFNTRQALDSLASGKLLISDSFRKLGQNEDYGNYLRIFENQSPLYDHFINTFVYKITTHAPMLPVSRSWDTINEGDGTTTISKA